jgi:hypothetical protein
MFDEDDKSLAGDLANYNWKIFACSVVFDNIYFRKADMASRLFLCAAMVRPCRLVPRFLNSFRFEESKT